MEFLSFLLNHTDGLFDDLLETRFDQRIACAVHTEREEPRPVITDNIQVSLTPGGADLELQELLRKEFESREVVYFTGRCVGVGVGVALATSRDRYFRPAVRPRKCLTVSTACLSVIFARTPVPHAKKAVLQAQEPPVDWCQRCVRMPFHFPAITSQ